MIRQLIDIFKLRIGLFMVITALAGYAVTPGTALGFLNSYCWPCVTLGASGAAGAFNQYMEWDLDRLMPRTAGRPFVTGAVHRSRQVAGADRGHSRGIRGARRLVVQSCRRRSICFWAPFSTA